MESVVCSMYSGLALSRAHLKVFIGTLSAGGGGGRTDVYTRYEMGHTHSHSLYTKCGYKHTTSTGGMRTQAHTHTHTFSLFPSLQECSRGHSYKVEEEGGEGQAGK